MRDSYKGYSFTKFTKFMRDLRKLGYIILPHLVVFARQIKPDRV